MALAWFMYKVTGEAFYVGLLYFMKQVAAFLLSPFAGVLADKISMKWILITTNVATLVLTFSLSFVVWKNQDVVIWILLIQGVSGLITGIDMPVRTAFVKELVSDHSQLINAIALNSSLYNIARICSPLLAGILIPLVGEVICILINAVTFLAVIAALAMMRDLRINKRTRRIKVFSDIKEGLIYTFSDRYLRNIMLVIASISVFGWPFVILLPMFAQEVLQGDVQVLGFLTTSFGAGSLLSALYMASRKNVAGLQVLICLACGVYGMGIILFANAGSIPLALIALAQVGIGQVLIFSSSNSLLQTLSRSSMTGRVISLYIMTFMGATTLGSFLIGILADEIGAIPTLVFSGMGCMATCIFLLFSVNSIKKRIVVTLRIKKRIRKYAIKEIVP